MMQDFGRCLTNFLLALMALSTAVRAETAEKPHTWVDRDCFPEAYSIFTSDRVMFPDNISDWPLEVDSSHQLFVDDHLIGRIEGLTRQFHQPTKHPANPLMPGGYMAVLYDKDKGRFRMWNNQHYLTGTDGVRWTRHEPVPEDEWRRDGGELRGFVYRPDLPEDEGRYKAVLERRYNEATSEPGGFYLYHSRDGIVWQQRPQRAILQRTHNRMQPGEFRPSGVGNIREFQWYHPDRLQSGGVGDTSTFRYDPVLHRYIFDGKFSFYVPQDDLARRGIVLPEGIPQYRLRSFSESEDLVHWSPPRFLMYPDRLDPADCQIYAHVGFVYESMWLGYIQTMRVQPTGWKQTELQLSYSRDGRHWLRPRDRRAFMPLGDDDSWEADYHCSAYTAPVVVGDELMIYYSSSRNADRGPGERWAQHIGLARLRRDGFASLDAGDKPGRIVTRPLTFKGKNLFVNADVAEGGWVKAAVLSRDSQPTSGRTLDESVPLRANSINGRMTWKAKERLDSPGEDHLRLLFELKNARLFSFWID